MAKSIVLPARLESSSARRLVECARALQSHPDAMVDASRVTFAEYGVVLLAAAVLRRLQQGLSFASYVPPIHEDVRAFLSEVGFDTIVTTAASGAGGTLPLRRTSPNSLDPSYTHGVGALIEREVPNTSESVAYLVEMALKEMLQNVVEHAGSSTDAVVLARWYRKEQNVRIAIADSGIGIVASLEKNPANAGSSDARVLVRRAVTVEGTTGRTAQRFGGLGLKHLHKLCVVRGGSVHVTSGTVDARYGPGTPREVFAPRLDGTVIEIDFRPGPNDGSRTDSEPEEFF